MTAVVAEQVLWTDADTDALRDLVADEDARQWQIGDFLLARLPWGKPGQSTGVGARLREVAAQVGAEPRALKSYRQTARAWPKDTRVSFATWAVHRAYEGSPDSAWERAETLAGLPRNEHGYVTVKAVRDMTRGTSGKPGWLELMGMAADKMLAASKDLAKLEAEIEARGAERITDRMVENAARYRVIAEDLAARFAAIEAA